MPSFVTELISTKVAFEAMLPWDNALVNVLVRFPFRITLFSGLLAANAELVSNLLKIPNIPPTDTLAQGVQTFASVYPVTFQWLSALSLVQYFPFIPKIIIFPANMYYKSLSIMHSPSVHAFGLFQYVDATLPREPSKILIPLAFSIGVYLIVKFSQSLSK